MSTTTCIWTEAENVEAGRIWADYQREHDVSEHLGQAVGIDPASGRVWSGETARDIVRRLDAEGIRAPLFFLRVGQDFCGRKGGR